MAEWRNRCARGLCVAGTIIVLAPLVIAILHEPDVPEHSDLEALIEALPEAAESCFVVRPKLVPEELRSTFNRYSEGLTIAFEHPAAVEVIVKSQGKSRVFVFSDVASYRELLAHPAVSHRPFPTQRPLSGYEPKILPNYVRLDLEANDWPSEWNSPSFRAPRVPESVGRDVMRRCIAGLRAEPDALAYQVVSSWFLPLEQVLFARDGELQAQRLIHREAVPDPEKFRLANWSTPGMGFGSLWWEGEPIGTEDRKRQVSCQDGFLLYEGDLDRSAQVWKLHGSCVLDLGLATFDHLRFGQWRDPATLFVRPPPEQQHESNYWVSEMKSCGWL